MKTAKPIQEGEAHPMLSHHEQREIGLGLQGTLVELVDLTLLGKQLHWGASSGPASGRSTSNSTSSSPPGGSWPMRSPNARWRSARGPTVRRERSPRRASSSRSRPERWLIGRRCSC